MGDDSGTPELFKTHRHRGVIWPNIMVDSSIDAMQGFDVRSDDVWVVTYPKSGTHWMMEIVGLILADGHPDKIDRSLYSASICMTNLAKGLPLTRLDEQEFPPDMTPFLEHVEAAPSPRIIWSHLSLKLLPPHLLKRAKVVYLARNPKDVLNALHTFYSRTPILWDVPFQDMFDQFLQEETIWEPWFDHVNGFWEKRADENLLFCKYEDLLQDPARCIQTIAAHIGRPTMSEDALQRVIDHSSIDGMKKTYRETCKNAPFTMATFGGHGQGERVETPYLQKGTCGQWKTRFTPTQNERFDQWLKEKMKGTDLSFTFE